MSAKSKAYAEQLNNAQVMSVALGANLETLKKRGMSDEFIAALVGLHSQITIKNSEQERLKAELRTATAEMEALMAQLHGQMKEAIKVVKLEVPKSQWVEFGIVDKR